MKAKANIKRELNYESIESSTLLTGRIKGKTRGFFIQLVADNPEDKTKFVTIEMDKEKAYNLSIKLYDCINQSEIDELSKKRKIKLLKKFL